MTIADVWGRIQAQDVFPIAHTGDTWLLQVPRSVVGRVLVEIWVEDEAGNIGYRAGIFQIDHGTIKCIEWLKTGGLVMLPIERSEATYLDERSTVSPLPFVCPKLEV